MKNAGHKAAQAKHNSMNLKIIISVLLILCCCGAAMAGPGTFSIKGKIYDGNRKPLESVSVVLTEAGNKLVRTELSSADGGFDLQEISSGKYVLNAVLHGYEKYLSDTLVVSQNMVL